MPLSSNFESWDWPNDSTIEEELNGFLKLRFVFDSHLPKLMKTFAMIDWR